MSLAPAGEAVGVAAPAPRRPGGPGAEAPSALQTAVEEASRRVSLMAVGEVEDLCVEVHKVTFSKRAFPDRKAVSKWLAAEAARLGRRKTTCLLAGQALKGKPVRVSRALAIARWIGQELAKVRAAAAPPPEGGEAKKATPKPLIITDQLSDPPGREYVFARPREAEEWLLRRLDLELERVAARAELVNRLSRALKTPATGPTAQAGVVVVFRPLDHFDKKQLFDHSLDAKNTVVAQFGLVTYKLQESVEGVRRAGSVK